MTAATGPLTIVLVGPGQQENLPLAYLGAAVAKAGHRPLLVRFDNKNDQPSCIDTIVRTGPALVGISIAFQYAVMDALDLVSALRLRGFSGHITCGGHVPTFCYEALLRDSNGLDSVVRHEGEATLVALADALQQGTPLDGIPGLIWRGEYGIRCATSTAKVQQIDSLAEPLRPKRLFEIGGVRVSFILTSRGCIGECRYCSISAFNRSAGGPRYRLRDPEKVAAEIGRLYYERDARIFFVQDDLFILPKEHQTLRRIGALTSALSDRRIVEAMFWIKGRPETITPNVLAAAKQMGARHLFLGVEHSVDSRLSYLGRRHLHGHNLRAIELCKKAGIRPSFNLMIFDPECTLGDVAAVVDFAATCPELPWNICRTEIYPGTHLFEQLEDQGRLSGDYRTFGYTMTDPRAEILFRILRVSFHEHAFDVESLLNKLISISFARQIHERYFPGRTTAGVSEEVDRLIAEAHRVTVEEIRAAIRFVRSDKGAGFDAVREFATAQAERIGASDVDRFVRFKQLWNYLFARGEAFFNRRDSRLNWTA